MRTPSAAAKPSLAAGTGASSLTHRAAPGFRRARRARRTKSFGDDLERVRNLGDSAGAVGPQARGERPHQHGVDVLAARAPAGACGRDRPNDGSPGVIRIRHGLDPAGLAQASYRARHEALQEARARGNLTDRAI